MQEMEEMKVPSLGREDSPGGGDGNPLQCSCLEKPTDRGSLAGYSLWGHKESDTTEHTHVNLCVSNPPSP